MSHSLSLQHLQKISNISHIWKWSMTGIQFSAKHQLNICILWFISDSLKVWSSVPIFCKLDPCIPWWERSSWWLTPLWGKLRFLHFLLNHHSHVPGIWVPSCPRSFDISRVSMNDTSTSFSAVSLKTWQSLATAAPGHRAGITSQWNHFSLEHKCLYSCSFHQNLACSWADSWAAIQNSFRRNPPVHPP